ncbi:MAG: 2-phospho-L-lactate transferase [Xanthobacteraceae bacterium]
MTKPQQRVLALAGGVGGAKLAAGLAALLGERLTVLVNTGDDFEHLGLHISPDLDTVVYTLAGIANPATGWGLAGETWIFMEQIERLGGPTWFRLGDRDLATHVVRTERLRHGDTLTAITADLCRAFNVRPTVLPMTDDCVRTIVHSGDQTIAFQDYFVRQQCAPVVSGISFKGAASARINPHLDDLEHGDAPLVIILCPSNPWLSIDPILAVPDMRSRLKAFGAPIVAVSPIVGGRAIKGPSAKIMRELGLQPSAAAVARHYAGLVDGFIIDHLDAASGDDIAAPGIAVHTAPTVMRTTEDRVALARECLTFADGLADRTS